jgi:methyl-accepting chemotaxis protein
MKTKSFLVLFFKKERLPFVLLSICGIAILAAPATSVAVRLLGATVTGLALFAMPTTRSAAPPVTQATEPPSAAPQSMALTTAPQATPQDMQTAMRLLGSAIVDQVETSVSTVLDENAQMRQMASEMALAAEQATEQFRHSMQRATESEASIEKLDTFSGQLADSIEVIGTAVTSSIAIVKHATSQAATTRGCMETMASLSASVADAIRLIDAIARRIRMLALNATIEAARAGEAGRGFAVVADEVKQLAHQTNEATRTIGGKIAEMTAMVDQSVTSLQGLVATVESVDAASGKIGQAISDQRGIASHVSTSLTDMRDAVFTLSREIREAAQIAANSGMLSDLVLETANSVDGLMNGLKTKLSDIGEGMIPVGAAQGSPPETMRRDAA